MKKKLPILLLVLVLCLSVAFAACKTTEKTTLDSIKVDKQPTKLVYTAGEKFDSTGIKVSAVYSDGTTKDVTEKCTYTPYGALNANNNKITVKYSEEINGEKVSKTTEISIRVNAAPVEDKVEIINDIVNATPADLPHVIATTSKATYVFYTYYDSTSMKCEATLELNAEDQTKGTFVYTEMSGHADKTYKLGTVEGSYAIEGDKMTLKAKEVHSVPSASDATQPNSGKLTSATTETADIVRDVDKIVGLNLGKASGNDKLWGWGKAKDTAFVEGLATAHGLTADVIYMEIVTEGKLTATQKSYYVTDSVGLYRDGDIVYGLPTDVLYEGDTLSLPADMFIGVNYVVPEGSTSTNLVNCPVDGNFTLAIKRGDETLPVDTALAVGDKLLITYDGVQGEQELNVHENPATPLLRKITVSAPYKSIYRMGDAIDLTGMTVTAHYTRGGADKEIDLSKCTLEVIGSDFAIAEYRINNATARVKIGYTEGDVTVSETIEVGVCVLPWNVVLQGNADFSYINYSKKTSSQTTFSAIQLDGDATSGTYYVTVLVTKDNWATLAKSGDYYVYAGNYSVADGVITFAEPANAWVSYVNGTMFYNPDKSEETVKNFVKNGGVKGTVTVENGIITAINFAQSDELGGLSCFFGFKNSKSYPMNFELVTGALSEDIAKRVPTEIYPQQAMTKSLVGMVIASLPDKLVYTEGEKFDLGGLKIVAYYNDGTKVDVTELSVADEALTTEDSSVTVTATLGDNTPYTFNFDITVKSAQAIFERTDVSGNYKRDYAQGELFNADNLVVEAVYSDGSKVTITNYVIADVDKALVKGTTKLTLTYTLGEGEQSETKTAEIEITVGDAVLQSLTIGGEYKNSYVEGEIFDKTSLTVTANYTDGDRDVTSEATIADGDKALTFGTTALTVSYADKTAEINITVSLTKPWLRAENSTAEYVFAANVNRKSSQYSWTTIEMFADGTFRATSLFMTSKAILHEGTYTTEGDNVTFVVSKYLSSSDTGAFAENGTFVATLVKNDGGAIVGLNFAYIDSTNKTDYLFGLDSAKGAVTLTAVTDGKLTLELIIAIPKGQRVAQSLRIEGEPVKEYTEGDSFRIGTMKVFVKYSDGAEYEVTDVAEFTPATNLTTDVTSIKVSFAGVETTIDGISVKQAATPALNAIEVTLSKTSYRVGEKLDLTGLVVTAKYTAGKADAVVTNYTLSFKDKDVTVTNGMYLGETVTLVVTYTEDEITLTKEIAIEVNQLTVREIAAQSNADYLFVAYAKKATKQLAFSIVELYGDLTSGGNYVVTIQYTKDTWKTSLYIVYAGNYTVKDGAVKLGVPTVIKADEPTTAMFYNDSNTAKDDVVNNGGIDGAIVTAEGKSTITFAADSNTTKFFLYDTKSVAVVCYQVVDGVIPNEVENALPDALKG